MKTPGFYQGASKRLNVDLGGCCAYAQWHFGGQNLYLDEVNKNIRFAQVISDEGDVSLHLNRRPPEALRIPASKQSPGTPPRIRNVLPSPSMQSGMRHSA
jgi:hypothetical protein